MEMLLRSKFPRNDYDEKYDMMKYKVANEYNIIAVLDYAQQFSDHLALKMSSIFCRKRAKKSI